MNETGTPVNDYQTAKNVMGLGIKVGKQTTVESVVNVAQFRKYFNKLAKQANQTFATKFINDKVLIIRIT